MSGASLALKNGCRQSYPEMDSINKLIYDRTVRLIPISINSGMRIMYLWTRGRVLPHTIV